MTSSSVRADSTYHLCSHLSYLIDVRACSLSSLSGLLDWKE